MQNKALRIGPKAVTGSASNMFNSALTSVAGGVGWTPTQPYAIITHLRVVNTTAGALNMSAFIGLTAGSSAGTEFAWSATSVPANGSLDWYGRVRLEATDFLTALSTTTGLTIEGEGEIGLT
jgi:hypothetical protein